jgi:hypothetical protein
MYKDYQLKKLLNGCKNVENKNVESSKISLLNDIDFLLFCALLYHWLANIFPQKVILEAIEHSRISNRKKMLENKDHNCGIVVWPSIYSTDFKQSNTHISTFIVEFFTCIMANNTSVISFLVSKKGNRQLVRDGFIYKFNKQALSKIYWICKMKGCNCLSMNWSLILTKELFQLILYFRVPDVWIRWILERSEKHIQWDFILWKWKRYFVLEDPYINTISTLVYNQSVSTV